MQPVSRNFLSFLFNSFHALHFFPEDQIVRLMRITKSYLVRSTDFQHTDHADLTGSLLVAVPTLVDPNFRRTIIFITRHEGTEGSLGIILNRPCGTTLGELTTVPEELQLVPVFEGGPVEQQQLLLARILLMEKGVRFESFDDEKSTNEIHSKTMSEDNGFRAFTGYAGWSAGQLESEIKEKSWLILPPTASLLEAVETQEEGTARWRGIMRELGSWYRLLADAPDDLSLN